MGGTSSDRYAFTYTRYLPQICRQDQEREEVRRLNTILNRLDVRMALHIYTMVWTCVRKMPGQARQESRMESSLCTVQYSYKYSIYL